MFFLGREDENKRSQENDRTGIYFIFLSNIPFWAYIKQIQHIHIWCMVIPLGPHLVLHLVRGPKAL